MIFRAKLKEVRNKTAIDKKNRTTKIYHRISSHCELAVSLPWVCILHLELAESYSWDQPMSPPCCGSSELTVNLMVRHSGEPNVSMALAHTFTGDTNGFGVRVCFCFYSNWILSKAKRDKHIQLCSFTLCPPGVLNNDHSLCKSNCAYGATL